LHPGSHVLISLGLTLVIRLVLRLTRYLRAEGQAQEVWSYVLLLWGAVLTIYHTQKGVTRALDGKDKATDRGE
jgi:ABC-type nickel/cobalt efflux system permease component RcnA